MTSPTIAAVTVIIPARNECRDIADAIASVGRQSFGAGNIDLVVVDGCSDDGTADIAKQCFDEFGFRRAEVVVNPDGRTPSNLNRGLLWADTPLIVRVDARSRLPVDYVERVVALLGDERRAVVGGRQVAIPPHDTVTGRAIARALNNSLGMGWSRYRRRGSASGAVDTVYLGAFRRHDLESVGGWGEQMASNQDFELNRRLGQKGVIWFDADLAVEYLPRSSISQLLGQYHRFGRWKAAYWRSTGDRPRPRQLALVALPIVGAVTGTGVMMVWGARGVIIAGSASALLLGFVDHVGAGGTPAPASERVVAIVANGAVGAGWLSGVICESARPRLLRAAAR